MGSEIKKRKINPPPRRRGISPSPAVKEVLPRPKENPIVCMLILLEAGETHVTMEQAKNFALAQAQQEGCTSNFRIIDSPFGNFLLPVIPARAELSG